MEAKEIKEFWWKPYMRKLFDKKVHVSCNCHQVGQPPGKPGKVGNLTLVSASQANQEKSGKMWSACYVKC